MPLTQLAGSCALDIKLNPFMARGQENIEAIMALIKGFYSLGGYFMQIDIVDNEILKDAQKHPEDHKRLVVRIWGWSAYFVELDKEYQDHIIQRMELLV